MQTLTTTLEERLDEQASLIKELSEQLKRAQGTITKQQSTIEDLLRRLYGRTSEKLDPNQALMESMLIDASEEGGAFEPPAVEGEQKKDPKSHRRNGRRPLPEHLPHHEIIVPVAEEEKKCKLTGKERPFLGYEETKKLEYIPETLRVNVYKREKYGSVLGAEEGGVVIAAKKPEAVPRALADTGLLAHIARSKFEDHLPLYRLERMWAREGVEVSRRTMSDWLRDMAGALSPITRLMRERILNGGLVHHDDTPVKMLDPGAGKTKETRLWASLGGEELQYVFFEFTTNRSKDGPGKFFETYRGHIMCDEYAGYAHILQRPEVTGLSCWAHARRRFDKAKTTKPEEASRALVMIGKLYEIERELKEESVQRRTAVRKEHSAPQMERIKEWLEENRNTGLPQSPFYDAVHYALNHWEGLNVYVHDGRLPIDNNIVERAIRAVAMGRKNWLFLGSEAGGKTAAVLMSLIGTCRHLGINSWTYLKDALERIPTLTEETLHELLPDVWRVEQIENAERLPS